MEAGPALSYDASGTRRPTEMGNTGDSFDARLGVLLIVRSSVGLNPKFIGR